MPEPGFRGVASYCNVHCMKEMLVTSLAILSTILNLRQVPSAAADVALGQPLQDAILLVGTRVTRV